MQPEIIHFPVMRLLRRRYGYDDAVPRESVKRRDAPAARREINPYVEDFEAALRYLAECPREHPA